VPLGAELRQLDPVGGVHLQRQLVLVADDQVDRRQVDQRRLRGRRHHGQQATRQDEHQRKHGASG